MPRSPTSPSRTSCSARSRATRWRSATGSPGRVAAAERALAGVFAERVASAQHDLVPRAAFDLGAVQLARGHLRAAQRTYEQGLRVTEGDRPSPSAGMLHVGLAEVHFERDELADAHRLVATGIEHCRRLAYLPALIAGLIVARAAPAAPRATWRARSPPSTRPTGRCPRPWSTRASRCPHCGRCSRWPTAMSPRPRVGAVGGPLRRRRAGLPARTPSSGCSPAC